MTEQLLSTDRGPALALTMDILGLTWRTAFVIRSSGAFGTHGRRGTSLKASFYPSNFDILGGFLRRRGNPGQGGQR